MAYSISSIIDRDWYNSLQAFSGFDNTIEYYIFTKEGDGDGYDDKQVALSLAEVVQVRRSFDELSSITGTTFVETSDYDNAPLNVYSVSGYDDPTTTGSASINDGWFDITWKNFGGALMTDEEVLTLVHEIGHVAGLDHPNGNGAEPGWDDSITVMSYFGNGSFVPTTFRELDIQALQALFPTNPVESLVPNFVHGNDRANDLNGTSRPDEIIGFGGNDILRADFGDDTMLGGQGDDEIYGNQGEDTIKGGFGVDIMYGGKDADQIYGNQGEDRLYGNLGDDLIYGGKSNDWQHGGQGEDRLYGNLGDDVLYGGKSNDWLHGGQGDDVLYGNLGSDVFNLSVGSDRVMDFEANDSDLISIRSGVTYSIHAQGSDLLINSDVGSLLLVGVEFSSFNSAQSIVVS